jgi:hypothetical protein
MQMVRVIDENGTLHEWDTEPQDPTKDNVSRPLEEALASRCGVPRDLQFGCSDLEGFQLVSQPHYCRGELLLAMASGVDEVTFQPFGDVTYKARVLPQTAATNAALAQLAHQEFTLFIANSMHLIKQVIPADALTPASCDLSYFRPVASQLASMLADSYYQGSKALEVAASNATAVADAQLNTTPLNALAVQRNIANPALSRAAVAHYYVGGESGLYQANPPDAYCTSTELSAQAKSALGIFRQSGVDPSQVLRMPEFIDPASGTTELTTSDLLGDTTPTAPPSGGKMDPNGGTVRARIEDLNGTTIPSNFSLSDFFGLKLEDFVEARRYLAEEIRTFHRSLAAKLAPTVLEGGRAPRFYRFAATATPPPVRDPVFFEGRAQDHGSFKVNFEHWRFSQYLADPDKLSYADDGNDTNRIDNLALFTDWAQSWANWLISQPIVENDAGVDLGNGTTLPPLHTLIAPQLAVMTSDSARRGRLVHCNRDANVDNNGTIIDMGVHSFSAQGFVPADGLVVVAGEDALECAVSGTIEGAACDLASLNVYKLDQPATTMVGFSNAAGSTEMGGLDPSLAAQRLYLLQPQIPGAPLRPGSFRALLGFDFRVRAVTSQEGCDDVPIVPAAVVGAAKALEPNRSWCARSELTCADTRFDERLPLEDELAQDNDNIESSWKHYLTLARQAADEADLLGQQYVQAGIEGLRRQEEVDLRAQQQQEKAAAELESVQKICGTTADITSLLEVLGSNINGFDLSHLDQGPCTSIMPPGTTCIGGRARIDQTKVIADTPELAGLIDCLASFGDVIAFLQLGDTDLCLWRDANGAICEGASNEACPSVKSEHADGNCPAPPGGTGVTVSKDDGLGFFSTQSTLPPPPKKNLCDSFRQLRKTPNNDALIQDLINSNIFNVSSLKQLRDSVSFKPNYNAHLSLKVGHRNFQTGAPNSPNTGEWPCKDPTATSPPTPSPSCEDGVGLFCDTYACDTPANRQTVNDRLARAVIAAQVTTWTKDAPAPMFDLPVQYTATGPNIPASEPPLYVGTVPISWSSNARWRVFEGDVLGGDAAVVHNLGRPNGQFWSVTRAGSRVRYGFGSVGIEGKLADQFDAFWGGLSQGQASDGYFIKRLRKAAHDQLLPPQLKNQQLVMGGNFHPQADCSTGCEFQLGCLCENDIANQIVDQLHGQDLDGNGSPGSGLDPSGLIFKYDEQPLLDGFELLCEAAESGDDALCDLADSPRFNSLADLNQVGSHLRCIGDEITRNAALTVFANIPSAAIAIMKKQAADHAYQAAPGDLGEALSQLRTALQEVSTSGPQIGRTIRNFGEDMRSLQAALEKADLQDQLADVQFSSQEAQQTANCLIQGTEIAAKPPWTSIAASAISCVNSIAQIGFADRIRNLQKKTNDLDRDVTIADFNKRFTDAVTTLELESTHLSEGMEAINRQVGIIQGLQNDALRAMNKAIWLLSSQATGVGAINTALSQVEETARVRYQRAHENAKRMAFLAKRAVEQRLGLHLSDMRDNLPLVEAPATWESTLCATSGVDFTAISGGGADGGTNATPTNFADSFIGDYVTKLENVVESYRLVHNFHEGVDTAVISLRDDVLNVRQDCQVLSPNLLYHSARLDFLFSNARDDQHNWYQDGCNGAGPCVAATARDDAPFAALSTEMQSAPGFTVSFGDGIGCPGPPCSWQPDAMLAQSVTLPAGRYRFSWYGAPNQNDLAKNAGIIQTPNGLVSKLNEGAIPADGPGWDRFFFSFELTDETAVRVGFKYSGPVPGDILLGAPMLEAVDTVIGANSTLPRPFSRTDDTRQSVRPVCEDTDGTVFRQTRWNRACLKLCPDGYSSNCEGRATTDCYRETSFQLSQRSLEEGAILNQSGFAKGNFNYRIDSIGLNFVGTGVRNCADSNLPSTCYGGGFVTYSLVHQGPYLVRNHTGADFRADLFTGLIENARGLGTERYLSNPLSSTDKSLLDEYLRHEFQGRPLDGTYVLRVWEGPGVDFNAIKDVQVVLNYRYWTRFN